MLEPLKIVLEIQELDMKMIRLMRLKKERQNELNKITAIKTDLVRQAQTKESEVLDLKKDIRLEEVDVETLVGKIKDAEVRQASLKKVEEFNALNAEVSGMERTRSAKEQNLAEFYDKLTLEEDLLKNVKESLETTRGSSEAIEGEISESVHRINEEGRAIKVERDALVETADQEIFSIYERLLQNKRDRVVVPLENRCCSGCHITLTAQHENIVRRGERIIFCEHCSRIHYWPQSKVLEETSVAVKRRRRRSRVS